MTTPSIFLAHGSPLLLDDREWVADLAAWARKIGKPKSVLMISAHWEARPLTIGATETVPLVYDFYGFPQRYYDVKYAAPGAPGLAARIKELIPSAASSARGLDHGAYVPMVAMYPEADVPTLQISIPTMNAADLIQLGRTLAPLREEGVLIVGSGFITHNMRAIDFEGLRPVPSWAAEFDAWTKQAMETRNVDSLSSYKQNAPGVAMSLPTHEHFVPALVALGSSVDRSESVTFPIEGFTYGSFTKRSIQFG